VQIFENQHKRPTEALAQKKALDRFLSSAAADRRVNLGEGICAIDDSKQCAQMRQGFTIHIEHRQLARNFFAPGACVVVRRDTEVHIEKVD